jgi:uncharacterized membrane-anchored protein YitT (DUF2179 family)
MNVDGYKALDLLIYALVHSVLSAMFLALILIVGGGTGGTDFVVVFLANNGKKFSKILVLVNISCLIIGCTIGSYIPCGIINKNG